MSPSASHTLPEDTKVSVTVVTYNHERFIGDCLEGIVTQQTRFPFEIVVGDDCSTDGTRGIIERYAAQYPSLIVPVFQKKNVGAHQNFQAILDHARGRYIAHMDGDDLMLPGKLQRQADMLDAMPDAALCFHNMRVFESDSGRTLGVFTAKTAPAVRDIHDLVRHGTVYCNSSKMYRRSALPAEGLDPGTRHIIDWLLHIQSARSGSIVYIDEVLGAYRKHRAGTTALAQRPDVAVQHFDELLYTVERARSYGVSTAAADYAESRIYYAFAFKWLWWGDNGRFRHAIEASVRHGCWVNRRHQRLAFRLRHLPWLVRAITNVQTRIAARKPSGDWVQSASHG